MNNDIRQKLIETFFQCDKKEIINIFNEFLNTLQAEESLPPGGTMSRNYETAQNNPEINTLPGNLKDARDAIFPFFWGTDEWFSKLHLENVKGPANYASLIGALACLLKNPNLCVDTYSQRSNELEVKAITSLANLVFYNTNTPWGVFNMGGTISNLYGGKIGIEKVLPGTMQKGVQGGKLCGLVSQAAHYSNATLAGWLGIGTDNLYSIDTDETCSINLISLEETLENIYKNKLIPAFIIATFGGTDSFGIDNIKEIRVIIEKLSHKYNSTPPQLHIDAAVGWTLCFLNEYPEKKNPFNISKKMVTLLKKIKENTLGFEYADSVTIDFHKMGWGHYPASAFIVNRKDDLKYLFRSLEEVPYFCEADYRRDPALFTLECSRPALGPYSVMASLNGLGLQGYQVLVLHALEMAQYLKDEIEKLEYCKVLNLATPSPSVVWWVLPKGRNAKEVYSQLQSGHISDEKYGIYVSEVKRLYDKRNATLDLDKDARLSFTTSIGYTPHNRKIPAWKAVFFNPKTDKEVVQKIIESIENI